jgi:hypothetical protein
MNKMSTQSTMSMLPANWNMCAEKILIHALTSVIDYSECVDGDSSYETMNELITDYGNKLEKAYMYNSEVLFRFYIAKDNETEQYYEAISELKFCIPIVQAMHADNSDIVYDMIEPYIIKQLEFEEENRKVLCFTNTL